jgi:hypothetical protein
VTVLKYSVGVWAVGPAKSRADALASQRAVYGALGLDEDYEAEVARRRAGSRGGRSPRSEEGQT